MNIKLKKAIIIIAVAVLCLFAGFAVAACSDADWGEWQEITPATCTTPGEQRRYKNDNKSIYEKREIPALGHKYGDWHTVTEPTHTSEGEEVRTCVRCAHEEYRDIPMVPTTYYIDVKDTDGNLIERVYTDDDGAYELTEPTLVGFEFIRFITTDGEPFDAVGTVSESMTVIADFEILPTTTFKQLYERAEAGAKRIMIAADISITGSVYVTGKTEITVETTHKLTRAPSFGGDMFIVGETEAGDNPLLSGEASALMLHAEDGKQLTIDGNKSNMAVDVSGTAILVLNSATVTMSDGVSIINCKKTANSKLLNSDYKISYPDRIGGAAMIIVNGSFTMNGGVFANNEVNADETGSDIIGDGDEKEESNRASSCGGAIYNYSTVTINGGVFENNGAARGGAIYNYRSVTVKAAEFRGNTAGVYGGAIYLPGSQYAVAYIGEENAPTNTVLFDGNIAEKSGGVMFGQMKNTIIVYGGATFRNNVAKSSNGGAINTSGALIIKNADFENNIAASKGGAIYMYYSDEDLIVRNVEIARGTFVGNRATKGGAIAFSSSDPDFKHGSIGVIGEENADAVDNAPYVIFRNNTALATETEDPELPELPDNDGEDTQSLAEADETTEKNYNGNGGAVYIARRANVTFNNVLFDENTAERKGGAVYVTSDGATLTDNGSSYTANASGGNGGAIYACKGANVSIDGGAFGSNISNSTEYGGGAVYFTASVASITNTEFGGNGSDRNGGAVAAYTGSKLTVDNCAFDGNTSANNGGALYANKSSVEITDSIFKTNTSNSTEQGGGAVYFTGCTANVSGSTFTENTSNLSGGALSSYTGTVLTVEYTVFENNESNAASGNAGGGAMYISSGTADITNVEFKNNKASRNGGAFCAYSAAQVNVYDITAIGNSSKYRGGVCYIGSAGTVVCFYSGEATSNTASNSGATVYCGGSSTLKIKTDAFTYEDGSINGTVEEL